jgi:hypothetical protein
MRNFISGVVAVFALLIASESSRGGSVVAPLGKLNLEGNTHNYYPFNMGGSPGGAGDSQRYQQAYGASDFAAVSGPVLITQIAFRPDAFLGPRVFRLTPGHSD